MLDLARKEEIVERLEAENTLLVELAECQLLLAGGGSGDVLWG